MHFTAALILVPYPVTPRRIQERLAVDTPVDPHVELIHLPGGADGGRGVEDFGLFTTSQSELARLLRLPSQIGKGNGKSIGDLTYPVDSPFFEYLGLHTPRYHCVAASKAPGPPDEAVLTATAAISYPRHVHEESMPSVNPSHSGLIMP